jgi:hypothetical protein
MAGITNMKYSDSYSGMDATGPYPITFSVILDDGGNASDIKVSVTDSLNATTDITATCTITGLNVYTAASYDDTNTILIYRDPALTQPYDIEANSPPKSRAVQKALNRLLFLIHKLAFSYDRSMKVPAGEPEPDALPDASDRANKYLAFDADGQPMAGTDPTGYPASPFMATVLSDADAAAARVTLGALGIGDVVSSSTTPYTMTSTALGRVFLITTGASAFVFNIASATALLGQGPYTVIKVDSGAGAIQVKPNSTDVWANAGNVSCYLGKQWESLTFTASKSGELSVLGGVFVPHQAVDTDGTQVHLGKLIYLPLSNTLDKTIIYCGQPPANSNWSTAYQITGSYGIPEGAKGIKIRIHTRIITGATSTFSGYIMCFSNNNSSTPSDKTSHPRAGYGRTVSGATDFGDSFFEIDVPLNSSGQFYIYSLINNNINTGVSWVIITPLAYYMGN